MSKMSGIRSSRTAATGKITMLSVTLMQTPVIYPFLNKMGIWLEAAVEQVLGTASSTATMLT
jgi:hypothetical protein